MDAEQQKKLMDQILELRQKVRTYATEHVHKCSDDTECLR
jgi:hypothetical protein